MWQNFWNFFSPFQSDLWDLIIDSKGRYMILLDIKNIDRHIYSSWKEFLAFINKHSERWRTSARGCLRKMALQLGAPIAKHGSAHKVAKMCDGENYATCVCILHGGWERAWEKRAALVKSALNASTKLIRQCKVCPIALRRLKTWRHV